MSTPAHILPLPLDTTACERDALRAAYQRSTLKHRYSFEEALRVRSLRICLDQLARIHRRSTSCAA